MNKLFFILLALFFVACEDVKLKLNEQAPEIFAKDTSNNKIKLKRQGIEIVQFWENGCAACLKVMASLNDYALSNNIKIYAINSINDLNTIKKHEREHNYKSIVFLKDEQDISWSRYEIFAVPTLFIIKDGVYIDRVLGDRGFKFIQEKLKGYL